MAGQPIDEKCVPIHLGFWQYGFNATYTHFVSTVGRDEQVIREYIRHQEKEGRLPGDTP
jgi:hypothetical protein